MTVAPIVGSTPQALATPEAFKRQYPSLCRNGVGVDALALAELMVETTSYIEETCDRRFAPFEHYYQSDVLRGLDPSDPGTNTDTMTDLVGSLGLSQAAAYGATNLVRHLWLNQTAPHYPELWTYSIESITTYNTFGSTMPVDPGSIEPPQRDTGHTRFRLGTFVPEGTTVEVIYSGGYTVDIPPGLQRLCKCQAAMFIMLDNEPQMRKEMNLAELDRTIQNLMANWAKA